MTYVIFAKMDQVFSLKKKQHLKNTGKIEEKNTGKVREFCQWLRNILSKEEKKVVYTSDIYQEVGCFFLEWQ